MNNIKYFSLLIMLAGAALCSACVQTSGSKKINPHRVESPPPAATTPTQAYGQYPPYYGQRPNAYNNQALGNQIPPTLSDQFNDYNNFHNW